jgi:hypothetical protein
LADLGLPAFGAADLSFGDFCFEAFGFGGFAFGIAALGLDAVWRFADFRARLAMLPPVEV